MKLSKIVRKYTGLLVSAVFVLLITLSSCQMGTEPPAIANTGDGMATLKIAVPNIAPWVQEKSDSEKMTPKAWLIGDSVYFDLYDYTDTNNVVDYTYTYYEYGPNPSSPLITNWEIAPGTYYLYSLVFNEAAATYLTDGYASVWGVYPEQDPWNPTVPFTISAGESLPIVITNYPTFPVAIPAGTATAEYFEATDGEKWFTVTTGPTDTWLYVDVGGYSSDGGVIDADMDLYLFGPDGLYIIASAEYSDGDASTPDYEVIDSDVVGTAFTVLPNSTYYVGVQAWVGGNFDLWFDSAP